MLLGSACVFSGVANAQTPFNTNGDQQPAPAAVLSGTPTIDMVSLSGGKPGFPLRFGNIVPGSETVEFEGRNLKKGTDYQIDYAAGVVYLMRAHKAGQSVRIVYRYEKSKQAAATGQTQFSSSLPAFSFDLTSNGSMKAVVGFGMAERQADGNVLMSNVYGWQNNTGGLKGLMLVGEREKAQVRSAYEYTDNPGETPTGKSKFILQNYTGKLNGGTIEASYQDISSNFASFGAVSGAGFEQQMVDQMAKEKGLKRFGFVVKDVQFGTAKISNAFRQVREGDATIQWKQFGFQQGGLKLNYTGQNVDEKFTRFNDLAEKDNQQLRNEAGLSRQSFEGSLGSLNFNFNDVEDTKGDGIYRRNVGLKTTAFDLSVSDQRIDKDFSRFGSLWENEKGQWGRESGITRQNLAMDMMFGGTKQPILRHSRMMNESGKFSATDFSLLGKGWSLQHTERTTDPGFSQLGSMSEGEMDQNIRSMAQMLGPNLPTNANDRHGFLQGVGFGRQATKVSGSPFKGWNVSIDKFKLTNQQDTIGLDRFSIAGPRMSAHYSNQNTGDKFNEFGRLMEFERQKLSVIPGLDRSDFGINFKPRNNQSLAVASTKAETPTGGMSRQSVAFTDPKFEASVTRREVDPAFEQVNLMVDPERDLLAALRGFKQQDIKLKWQMMSNLKIDTFMFDAVNNPLSQVNKIRTYTLNWNPDRHTSIEAHRHEQEFRDPLQVLFANMTNRLSVTRDFGRLGTLTFLNETVKFDGINATAPDSKKQYLAYETKINATTSVKAEQSKTEFDNGDKEDVSAHTISTELTKKVGVSMTDLKVDRNGDDRDEKRRNYGFWLNLGNGMKLSYGIVRQINGYTGTLNSNVSITPGTIDWFQLQSAGYTENRWDGQNAQGLSNIAFQSSRPINLGLFQDFKFAFSMDTATDRSAWVRENRAGSISGKFGSNTFSMDYRGQMHASGYRGIDRSFKLQTDQSDKARLKGHFFYTDRKLPNDRVMIRDVGLSYRQSSLELSHSLLTNPETPNRIPDLPMFTQTDPWRVAKWALKWDVNPASTLTANWEERINDLSRQNSRLAGVTLDLFKTSGSPLQLFWGLEQQWGNTDRQTLQRFSLRYDQRPGPNQLLSLYVGNVSYQHKIAPGFARNNLSLNVNYQLKF